MISNNSYNDKSDLKNKILSSLDFHSYYQSELGELGKINSNGWSQHIFCPFHNEKKPSMGVNINDGQFNCFGCGQKGSVFDFYMKKHEVNFKIAMNALAKIAGIEITSKYSQYNKPINTLSFKERFNIYSSTPFPDNARIYLKKTRKLNNEIINLLLDQKLMGWNEKGWFAPNDFRQAIVFPIYDWHGKEIVGLQNIFIDGSGKKFVSKSKIKKFLIGLCVGWQE